MCAVSVKLANNYTVLKQYPVGNSEIDKGLDIYFLVGKEYIGKLG